MTTFDGESLIITLPPTVGGVLDVDVQADLYEPWKDWVRAKPKRRGYPQAFTPDGGNALTSILDQGRYSFLNNVAGWRIKPHESNGTYYFTGNLAVADTTLPALIPTVGAYTTAVLGLQPITQGITPELLIKVLQIWGRLALDPDNPLTNRNDNGFSFGDINVLATLSGDDIIQTRQ